MAKTAKELVAEAQAEVSQISCDEYIALKDDTPHMLIDVRERDEWDEGFIEGAIHIPRGLIEFKIDGVVPEKDTLIILYCRSGGRSSLCGQALIKLGYTNVRSLVGGYEEFCKTK
jgi:rhodanese-related sulfurtransferase